MNVCIYVYKGWARIRPTYKIRCAEHVYRLIWCEGRPNTNRLRKPVTAQARQWSTPTVSSARDVCRSV
jgi:hypothetical protein